MRSQSETEIKEFPAPAKQLTNWKGVEGVFLGAALLCFLFLIYSVLQENNPDSWSIRLLGINASASLFSAFLSLFFLRRQFMHSVAPLLAYRNKVTTKSDTGFSCGEADARFYVVDLTNVGRGIGIVTGARYWVELAGEGDRPVSAAFMDWFRQRADRYGSRERYRYTYQEVQQILERGSIKHQEHFEALHFGEWSAFAPNEKRTIFEICFTKATSIVALDIEITYQSLVGDRYRREIYVIPRRQLTSKLADDMAVPKPHQDDLRASTNHLQVL